MELKDTIKLMESNNYKDKFRAEYWQTKIRYEKLKNLCDTIEIEENLNYYSKKLYDTVFKSNPIKHDCSLSLLRQQQRQMGKYLHILELRAKIENVDLNKDSIEKKTPIVSDSNIKFGFDEAIRQLKKGKAVKRLGWNGKKQFITLDHLHHEDYGNNKVIIFHGTSDVQIGWLATQKDMLAEDWVIV